ncbi:hypothetical protein ACRXCV_00210 (plasmid) [Halobacteriovorax sp. GFR7]|uniref:hypothetical protein n=1 Tax=unclassified Halobacteriovorax TaxID=2639665 RepID=UPI003D95982F
MNILFWAAGASTTVIGSPPEKYTVDNTYKDVNAKDARGVYFGDAESAKTINFVSQQDVYLSFTFGILSSGSWYSTPAAVELAGVFRLYPLSSSQDELVLQLNEQGSWVSYGSVTNGSAKVRLDVIYERDAVNGLIEVRVDGAVQASYTGDTTTGSYPATSSSILIGCPNTTNSGTTICYVSNFFQMDESTAGAIPVQLGITANGTHTDFEGNDFDMINDVGLPDSTLIASKVVGDKSTFVIEDVPTAYSVGYDVIAVGVGVRASSGGTSSPDLAVMIKDGANEVESSTILMDAVKKPRIGTFHTAPDAGAWTVAKVNSVECGVTTK